MSSKKTRGVFVYKSYSFVDKNPALDLARDAVQRSGKSFKEIRENGGAAPGTLNGWFNGATRNCHHDTWVATIKAAGGDVGVQMPKSSMWVKLPSKAK